MAEHIILENRSQLTVVTPMMKQYLNIKIENEEYILYYIRYEETNEIPKIYIIQLIFNLLWSFVFFKFKLLTLAFFWILFCPNLS